MSTQDRQPPRFVPTLTDVVGETVSAPAVSHHAEALPSTQAVEDIQARITANANANAEEEYEDLMPLAPVDIGQAAINLNAQDWQDISQQALARVMARVDVVLEERLRYALADVVQEHTAALYQAMRQEVEQAVHLSVQEAIAEELGNVRTG
jgi:hypothetical protein